LRIDEMESRWRLVGQGLRRAFKHTPRPGDYDLFPNFPKIGMEESDYLKYLCGKTWKEVDISECGFTIQYLTAAGWRHFLPAYLLEATAVPFSDTGFQFPIDLCILWPRGEDAARSRSRIAALSPEELAAVREYMRFASDCVAGGAKSAWDEFWAAAEYGRLPEVC